jgi:hypothetical protein
MAITVEQLEGQHPRAAEALWLIAFYNRQNIPRYLPFKHTGSSSADLVASDARDEIHGFEDIHHEVGMNTYVSKINNTTPKFDLSSELSFDQAIGTLAACTPLSTLRTMNMEKITPYIVSCRLSLGTGLGTIDGRRTGG